MNYENDEDSVASENSVTSRNSETEASEQMALEGVRGLVRGCGRNTREISRLSHQLRVALRRVLEKSNENQRLLEVMAQLTTQLNNATVANGALTRENRRLDNENQRFNNENQRLLNALTAQNLQITNCPRTNHAPNTVITTTICHRCNKTTPIVMHNP